MARPRLEAALPYLGAMGIVVTALLIRMLADPFPPEIGPYAVFLVPPP